MNCAKKPGITARKVVAHTIVRAFVRTVQRVLQNHPEMNWEKPKVRPALTKRVIDLRFTWAEKMLNKSEVFWRKTLFTDERRFTSDGSDGISHYWQDNRLPPSIFSKRARGGGGLMVWAGISWRGKTELRFISGNMDAMGHTTMLESVLPPFIEDCYPEGLIF